jgi:hypothetical protein
MKGQKKQARFNKGDKVTETGSYVCEICHTEGGVESHEFHKGDKFPACMNCGDATQWTKAEEEEDIDE